MPDPSLLAPLLPVSTPAPRLARPRLARLIALGVSAPLLLGSLLGLAGPAQAWDGCGWGFHAGYGGRCVPNHPPAYPPPWAFAGPGRFHRPPPPRLPEFGVYGRPYGYGGYRYGDDGHGGYRYGGYGHGGYGYDGDGYLPRRPFDD